MPFPGSYDRLPRVSSAEEQRERVRRLRAESTQAEAALWRLLRNRQLLGGKFRRQAPIGRYVADFFCHEEKLIVELDGGVHAEPNQQIHDQNRDLYLLSLGLKILRVSNEEVLSAPEGVLERIRMLLSEE